MGHVCVDVYYDGVVITVSRIYSEIHQLVKIILSMTDPFLIILLKINLHNSLHVFVCFIYN